MPKIDKGRIEKNERRIMAAALKLFTTQGFHGTNIRDIAKTVGVSTGAIYTYYPSKETIFARLAESYHAHREDWLRQTCAALKSPLTKNDLRKLAAEVRSYLYKDPEYLLLVYIDVVEFQNQHFAAAFRDVPEQFRGMLGSALCEVKQDDRWRGEDPAFVLASVYLYFFTSAAIEKLYQGNRHLGVSDEQATGRFVDLLCQGLWKGGCGNVAGNGRGPDAEGRTKRQVEILQQSARDRIDLMRMLSGRLWSSPPDLPSADAQAKVEPIMFVPKISHARIDQNQLKIEAAALELFTSQGFHSTRMREIAEKAGMSSGSIYTYYPSKEELFRSLVKNYRSCMRGFRERVLRSLDDPFCENGLRLLAFAVRSMVYHDAEYQLLTLIDIIEFRNQHFADTFYRMPEQFRRIMGPVLNKVKKQKGWCGEDPAFALAAIYLYFFTYFTVERLMQRGNQHLGVPDSQAIERFISLLSHGLWRTEKTMMI
ncbi:MAG TPA: TetR/AcrR family transcriptional regulator [Candidatus Saccharimonadales bacterium]|nr:TetR/AcrR family transcriptional regulator [Candidatus Saccharimonadales bacterium]